METVHFFFPKLYSMESRWLQWKAVFPNFRANWGKTHFLITILHAQKSNFHTPVSVNREINRLRIFSRLFSNYEFELWENSNSRANANLNFLKTRPNQKPKNVKPIAEWTRYIAHWSWPRRLLSETSWFELLENINLVPQVVWQFFWTLQMF